MTVRELIQALQTAVDAGVVDVDEIVVTYEHCRGAAYYIGPPEGFSVATRDGLEIVEWGPVEEEA